MKKIYEFNLLCIWLSCKLDAYGRDSSKILKEVEECLASVKDRYSKAIKPL